MAWTAHAPGPAGPRSPAKVPHSHLILQRQPLTTRARQHCTRRDRVPAPPSLVLVIDHRIMLDVESVPGPFPTKLIWSFSGTERLVERTHCCTCLESVSVWQSHKTDRVFGGDILPDIHNAFCPQAQISYNPQPSPTIPAIRLFPLRGCKL
jgi:hypothetical protein